MIVDALASHPDIPTPRHEWDGTEDDFWEHPYVLSNRWHDFFEDEWIRRIHVYRENAIAGAKSMLLMQYVFPDGVAVLPPSEVLELASLRKQWDNEFSQHAEYTTTYELICRGEEVNVFPDWLSHDLCDLLGVRRLPLRTRVAKTHRFTLKNEEEIRCLA